MARYAVTRDWSRIVPETSPEAAFLVDAEDAKRLGLAADAPAEAKEAELPEDKAVHGPPEDKALRPSRRPRQP
jgi:hypothetical protein